MPKPSKGKSKKDEGEEPVELDFGLGKLSFGGFFKGLGQLIDMASTLQEKGEGIKKEGTFKAGKVGGKEVKGVYGFSIRTLAGGKPVVETFGNVVKKTAKGPVVEEVREPLTDLFDEKDRIKVIAELPGVTEAEVKTELKGDILTITTTGQRQYTKEILLPAKVKEGSLKVTYRNGILEIELEKA
jgi:HSP20 family protein